MPETNNPNQRAQKLKDLSQCIFDILEMIRVHLDDPTVIDKKLHEFYVSRRNTLLDLDIVKQLSNRNEIRELNKKLGMDLLYIKCRTEKQKEKIYNTELYLTTLLAKVQNERIKIPGFVAHTGIADEKLKEYIDILGEKRGNKETVSQKVNNTMVVTHNGGNYYYLGKLMNFIGKEALYFKIFEIIFQNQKDNFITYEEIINHFREKKIDKNSSRKKNIKKIQSAMTDRKAGFNRSVKVEGVRLMDLNEYPKRILMVSDRSRGIKFNNQR